MQVQSDDFAAEAEETVYSIAADTGLLSVQANGQPFEVAACRPIRLPAHLCLGLPPACCRPIQLPAQLSRPATSLLPRSRVHGSAKKKVLNILNGPAASRSVGHRPAVLPADRAAHRRLAQAEQPGQHEP